MNKKIVKLIIYILGASLLLGGIASLLYAGEYWYVSFTMIVIGCVSFALIPLGRKDNT